MELTRPERDLLIRLVESAVGEVRSGVRRTHNPAWHDGLKEEEGLLTGLLEKLSKQ